MEISLTRSSLGKLDVGFCSNKNVLNAKIFYLKNNMNTWNVGQCQSLSLHSNSSIAFTIKASATAPTEAAVVSDTAFKSKKTRPIDGVKFYVGLPLDAVSDSKINHARAIAAGLKALKLLGVEGVELPIWWGVAEKEVMGKYDWTGYLAVAEMVQKLGLKLHVSLCFHASSEHKVPLPQWLSQIGELHPDIYFTDRLGQHYKDCLSLAVDDLPVLEGKTPIEVYRLFCESFRSSFSAFFGSTITGISVGLGPDGELRYPSHHQSTKSKSRMGAGEFQCYDKHMLENLKQHAEAHGTPLWGIGGPHDAPSYSQSPIAGGFFAEHGGSWETPYGDFFLSWYSSQLICHGDRMLSLAASTFKDVPVSLSAKVPSMYLWYRTRSHPSELTAGIYNTINRDGYQAIAETFLRYTCKMILPGMDLSDDHLPAECFSSPELLLSQIRSSCRKHGVELSGQNSSFSVAGAPLSFEQIEKNLLDKTTSVDSFSYQRMGASFFSPEHFLAFTKFVRSINQRNLQSDDLLVEQEETVDSNLHMQAA